MNRVISGLFKTSLLRSLLGLSRRHHKKVGRMSSGKMHALLFKFVVISLITKKSREKINTTQIFRKSVNPIIMIFGCLLPYTYIIMFHSTKTILNYKLVVGNITFVKLKEPIYNNLWYPALFFSPRGIVIVLYTDMYFIFFFYLRKYIYGVRKKNYSKLSYRIALE